MTKPNRSTRGEARRRPRRTPRHAAGIVAQYIHELSERHAEEAARSRQPAAAAASATR